MNSSMEHVHNHSAHGTVDHLAAMQLECDGSINGDRKGSWIGHVYPGAVFIFWGSWWALNTMVYYIWQSSRRPYRGRPWFPFPLLRCLRLLEPALKVVVPFVAVSMELYFDHQLNWRYLYCPRGTKYEGRFAMTHANNWGHAASYPAVVLSGLVDLASLYVPLPAGTSQAVLGCAFGIMAFLMGTHEKHEPQDKMVHWLLFLTMLLCTLMVFMEMALRRNVLTGMGKALALVFQGAWLVQIAAVEFEGRPQWSTDYPGGAMLAPVFFSTILLFVLAAALAVFVLLAVLKDRGVLPRALPLPPAPEDEDEEQEWAKHGNMGLHYDSANHSDDNEGLLDGAMRQGGTGRGIAPFQIMHTRSGTKDSADAYV